MHLSDDQIREFQELYERHYGEVLTRQEAHDRGMEIVRLFELIYKPINKN